MACELHLHQALIKKSSAKDRYQKKMYEQMYEKLLVQW